MIGEDRVERIEPLFELLEGKIREIDDLYTNLQAVCGHTPSELLTLFKEGYKLTPLAITPESLVKRGRWVYDPNGMDWNIGAWVCSECGTHNHNIWGKEDINPLMFSGSRWCPACGAKMVED